MRRQRVIGRDSLLASGFVQGKLDRQTAEIDADVCESLICRTCRFVGLLYEPYVRPRDGRYVVIARCPVCRYPEEV